MMRFAVGLTCAGWYFVGAFLMWRGEVSEAVACGLLAYLHYRAWKVLP